MRSPVKGSIALTVAAALLAAAAADAQQTTQDPEAWQRCCGLAAWPDPGPIPDQRGERSLLFGGYASIVAGSAVRHHVALEGAIPRPYAELRNPLPPTAQNAQRGAAVYEASCASCHGVTGLGEEPASHALNPPPAHLAWIAKLRRSRWDPFMYWSIAEGGAPFGTDMPSFKGKLTNGDIWSVIGYIQARLPKARAP